MIAYPPLIQKDPSTHIHVLAVYVKEGLPFAQNLSLENSAILAYVFSWLYFTVVSHFFFRYQTAFLSLCMFFDSISSNVDQLLLINPSANVFVFGDFTIHHKDWVIYSRRTDTPGKLCYNFSNDLTQIVNFPTHSDPRP